MQQTKPRTRWLGWLIAAVLGATLGFGMAQTQTDADVRKSIQVWSAAFEEIVNTYVDPVDPEQLMEKGLESMLNELDPYTNYINESERAAVEVLTQGRYIGVGLEVDRRGRYVVVESVVDGTAADRANLAIGDILLRIDGDPIDDWTVNQVRAALRGSSGSNVTIDLERSNGTTDTITLVRGPVELVAVPYSGFIGASRNGMGYIRLERFTQRAASEVRRAVDDLQQNRPLNGLVLDLRGNPGGLLDAAVDVGGLFLERGSVIVSTQGRTSNVSRTYRSTDQPRYPSVPLVVLVDERSASASEILAGAVQDHDRGVVLGRTTFGKGLVQVVRSLPHGGSLKVTTARYYTPSGRSIQMTEMPLSLMDRETMASQTFETMAGRLVRDRNGIEPDIPIDDGRMGPLENALQEEGAFFRFASHIANEYPRPPSDGWESATLLTSFQEWIDAEDIRYETEAQSALHAVDSLVAMNHPDAESSVDALHDALSASIQRQFEREANALTSRLLSEVRTRYLTSRGYYAATLAEDEMVQESVQLINDESRYITVLNP